MRGESPDRLAALAILVGIGLFGLTLGMGGATWMRNVIAAAAPASGAAHHAAGVSPRPPVHGYAQGGDFDVRAHSDQVPGVISGGSTPGTGSVGVQTGPSGSSTSPAPGAQATANPTPPGQ